MFAYVLNWEAFKNWLSAELGLTHAALHIHVGLAVYLVASRFARGGLASPLPLALVALLEALNETSDFIRYRVSHWPWTPGNTVADIVNTLFWPTLFYLFARKIGFTRTGNDVRVAKSGPR